MHPRITVDMFVCQIAQEFASGAFGESNVIVCWYTGLWLLLDLGLLNLGFFDFGWHFFDLGYSCLFLWPRFEQRCEEGRKSSFDLGRKRSTFLL